MGSGVSRMGKALGKAVPIVDKVLGKAVPIVSGLISVVTELVKVFSKPPPRPPPQVESEAVQHQVQKSVREIVEEARKQMGVDCINHYNFGVCGQSGVGKSSFINGILGLQGDDACSVGEVETTQKVKKYSTKQTPYLAVWDIPGAGTINHPADTYFEDKKLYVFDAILILSSDRFLKVDIDILQSARKYETPCAFVRTKCDIAVESRAMRDRISAFDASLRFREDVTANFLGALANAGLRVSFSTPELFFISNHFFLYDDAYTLFNRRTKTFDTSLSSMDEDRLILFILDAAKRRAPKK